MAPLAPAPELLIGMKTMVPAPLKSGVTPPLVRVAKLMVRSKREKLTRPSTTHAYFMLIQDHI